jgi:two-component system response regulator MprA
VGGRNRTILVVDDDRSMQLTLASILEDDGYAVVVADDGLEALATLEVTHPHLIVLDVGLPRMDGYAFAAELVRRGLRPQISLVVITADGRAAEKAARVGADAFLAKPFALPELLACVSQLVGRQNS